MCGQNAELMNDKQGGELYYTEEPSNSCLIQNLKDGIVLLELKTFPSGSSFVSLI
jgi:hypothetical protein